MEDPKKLIKQKTWDDRPYKIVMDTKQASFEEKVNHELMKGNALFGKLIVLGKEDDLIFIREMVKVGNIKVVK